MYEQISSKTYTVQKKSTGILGNAPLKIHKISMKKYHLIIFFCSSVWRDLALSLFYQERRNYRLII